jgi:hypothetical protein
MRYQPKTATQMDIKQIEKDGFIIEETKTNMGSLSDN